MGMTDTDRPSLKRNGGGGSEAAGASLAEPLAVRVIEAARLTGESRSSIYRSIRKGELDALKSGAATLVTFASLKRRLANLPRFGNRAA
jgi:excisionase family DNA binding protein